MGEHGSPEDRRASVPPKQPVSDWRSIGAGRGSFLALSDSITRCPLNGVQGCPLPRLASRAEPLKMVSFDGFRAGLLGTIRGITGYFFCNSRIYQSVTKQKILDFGRILFFILFNRNRIDFFFLSFQYRHHGINEGLTVFFG